MELRLRLELELGLRLGLVQEKRPEVPAREQVLPWAHRGC